MSAPRANAVKNMGITKSLVARSNCLSLSNLPFNLGKIFLCNMFLDSTLAIAKVPPFAVDIPQLMVLTNINIPIASGTCFMATTGYRVNASPMLGSSV